MLLRFAATNFRSIKDRAEVSFVATSLKELREGLIPSRYAPFGVLPVMAVYGANASGKSNLLIGLARMRNLVRNSFGKNDEDNKLPYEPFCLDNESSSLPTRFELDFSLEDIRYQYGVAYTGERIAAEWLYAFPKQTRQILYHREFGAESEYHFGRALTGSNRQIQSITRPATLFLSAAVKSGHAFLCKIGEFLDSSIRVQLNNDAMPGEVIAKQLEKVPEMRSKVANYLSLADTGVTEIKIEKTPIPESRRQDFYAVLTALNKLTGGTELPKAPEEDHSIKLGHTSSDGQVRFIEFSKESLGTRYLSGLLPPLIASLELGGTLVLDEITTGLHTLLAQKLVALFCDPKVNSRGAQLIFTTHDTNLLAPGLLRRDEILLAEKSKGGESNFFPLSDIKTKNSDNIERGYIQGRFGAIPYIGDMRGYNE